MTKHVFPIWRTLTIGGKTKEQLIAELKSKGFKIGDWARDMMGQKAFTTSLTPIVIPLVRPTIAELGFAEGGTRFSIWNRAKWFGLTHCPAEVGPHQRLADADQANGESYWIGMEPITDSGDYPLVFRVGHDGDGRWLYGYGALPDVRWNPDSRLVFAAPGK